MNLIANFVSRVPTLLGPHPHLPFIVGPNLNPTFTRTLPFVVAAFAALVLPTAAKADVQALVFPDVSYLSHSSVAPGEARSKSEVGVGLFASGKHADFVWLAEYFKSKSESEMERLQVGWRFGERDVLWLGRMHTPIGFWNTEYHHGTYLQTTRHRTQLDDFEDENSPLPKHFIGLLWDGSRATSAGGLVSYSFAWGQQPRWGETSFEPRDILGRIKTGRHRYGGTARVSYRADEVGSDQAGVSVHHFTALGDGLPVRTVEQTALAAHVVKTVGSLKLSSTLVVAKNTVTTAKVAKGHFFTMWLQAEHPVVDKVTAYARTERTFRVNADPLLQMMPGFEHQERLVGLRWDFATNQALRIEFIDGRRLNGIDRELAINWSAVFP